MTRHRQGTAVERERTGRRQRRRKVDAKVERRGATEGQVVIQRVRARRRQRDRRAREVVNPTGASLGKIADAKGVRAFQGQTAAVGDFSTTGEGVVTRQAEELRRTGQRQLTWARDVTENAEVIGAGVSRDHVARS